MATSYRRLRTMYVDGLVDAATLPAADLEATGRFDVTQVRTLEAAETALERDEYDCLVTTTALGAGSYADLITAAREQTPPLPTVVVCTAEPGDPSIDSASDDGLVVVEADQAARDGGSLQRVVASQIERLVDRRTPAGQSLAEIPAPAFAYEERFVDWNEAFLELVGVDEATLDECSLADVFDCISTELASAAADGVPLEVEPADPGPDPVAYEIEVGRELGRYVCLVEERPAAEPSIEQFDPAEMLSSLLEGIPLAMYFKDEQSRHVAVSHYQVGTGHEWFIENPEGKIHHSPEDVIGKSDFDLYSPDDAERAIETDREVMETEEPQTEETRLFTVQSGDAASLTSVKDLAMRSLKAPWYDADGDVVGVVGVTLDVTEHWENEHRLAVNEAILETIDAMLTQQLQPVGTPDAGREVPAIAASEPARYDRVVSDVETLLRTRDQPESTEHVDLADVARDAWEDVTGSSVADGAVDASGIGTGASAPGSTGSSVETIEERVEPGIEAHTSDRAAGASNGAGSAGDGAGTTSESATLSIEAPSLVDANPEQLRVLLAELFENAIRHSGPDVEVVLGELDSGFFVDDDGPGITPDRRENVFEYGTTGDPDAVGGGLAIVKAIALAHGWETTIEDGALGGTRVVVSDLHFY